MSERIGELDGRLGIVEDGVEVQEAMSLLSERDREVLHLRFVEDLTQREIAAKVGVSQMQISRILRASIERLRAEVGAEAAA